MICISWSFGGPARMRPKSAQNLGVAGNAHFRLALDPNCQETPVVTPVSFPAFVPACGPPLQAGFVFLGVPPQRRIARGERCLNILCPANRRETTCWEWASRAPGAPELLI